MISLEAVYSAADQIRGVADNTPMVPSAYLSRRSGTDFLLKLENTQSIGAFKLRGAWNAIAKLPADCNGVTCCSTGNHGRAVAFAAAQRGMQAVICMSELVPQAKIDGIKALGGKIRIVGRSQDDAQVESTRLVAEEGLVEIPPFDHPDVISAQGTIALEMLAARPDIKTILVPMSGGGLAAGVAMTAKALSSDVKVIGISMDQGAAMHQSLQAGKPVAVDEAPSLADSLGGGVGLNNQFSFALCQRYLDQTILVTEEEIRDAMQVLFFEDRIVAEGACVVGIAAFMSGKLPNPDGPVATIITGRNLDMHMFLDLMAGKDVRLGETIVKGRRYAG